MKPSPVPGWGLDSESAPPAEWQGFTWTDFEHVWSVAESATLHSKDYGEALYELTRRLVRDNLDGNAIAEFGVGAAGLSLLMQVALKHAGDEQRQLHLYDSFRGVPEIPHPEHDPGIEFGQWHYGHADGAIILMPEKVRYMFIGSFREYMIPPDAVYDLVHLDVKLYGSYVLGLEAFWPRIRPGGALVLGDYSSPDYPGCRIACAEGGFTPDSQDGGPLSILWKP